MHYSFADKGHPIEMLSFPSLFLSWKWVGRSNKSKKLRTKVTNNSKCRIIASQDGYCITRSSHLAFKSVWRHCWRGWFRRQNNAKIHVERFLTFALGFILLRSDWLQKIAPLSRPIRSKPKNTRNLLTRVFPRVTRVTCTCFEFWLVHCVVRICCDWSEWFLWFYHSQLKTVLHSKNIREKKASNESRFFVYLSKHWVGRAMGKQTFNLDSQIVYFTGHSLLTLLRGDEIKTRANNLHRFNFQFLL